jgi:hypothetical protein
MVARKIRRNQNFIGAFIGATGSGKSYSALSFCEYMSARLGVPFSSENIVFSPQALMSLINSGNLRKGSCILFEESGVTYSNRQWQSINNQLINYLIETFRDLNYVVFFTVPNISFIDVVARKLIHCLFETKSINYEDNFVVVKPFMIQVSKTGKVYYKYLKVSERGRVVPTQILRLNIYLASDDLIGVYDDKKEVFGKELRSAITKGLSLVKGRGVGRPKKINEIMDAVMQGEFKT